LKERDRKRETLRFSLPLSFSLSANKERKRSIRRKLWRIYRKRISTQIFGEKRTDRKSHGKISITRVWEGDGWTDA